MYQYNNFPRFPGFNNNQNVNVRFNGYPRSRFGGSNKQHPAHFNNNSQRHHNPPYFVRYGPPVRPVATSGSHWRFQMNHSTTTPILRSPSSSIPITTLNALPSPPPRPPPRGPRTPPYPPPDSEPETTDSTVYEPLSPRKFRQGNKERRNKHKFRKQLKQEHHFDNEHQKIQRRRNSCPTQPQRRSSQNANNCNYNSSPMELHKSAKGPSSLNTAVQSYLLQVLTSQPPPGVAPASTPYPALIHPPPPLPPSSQTPPPLPPSPPAPSEDKDQESQLNLNSKAKNNQRADKSSLNMENGVQMTPPALTIDIPNEEDRGTQENDKAGAPPLVKIKAKRKKISSRNGSLKDWTMEEAQMALKTEQELSKEVSKDTILYLRFPDPPISREMVKAYSTGIESVHFQQHSAPRFCFAHLKEGVDVDKIIENISKIPFGMGFVKAELRQMPVLKSGASAKAENIDPFTLYVGNLSTAVPCKVLKEHFAGAARIDIGFAQRMKYTRYAFIRFHKVEEAIAAYRRMLNSEIDGRSLILRFRRFGAASKNDDSDNLGVLHEDEELVDAYSMISTSTVPSDTTEGGFATPITERGNEKQTLPLANKSIYLSQSLHTPNEVQIKKNAKETVAGGEENSPKDQEKQNLPLAQKTLYLSPILHSPNEAQITNNVEKTSAGSEEGLSKDKVAGNMKDDAGGEHAAEKVQIKHSIPAIESEAVGETVVELSQVADLNQIDSHDASATEASEVEYGFNTSTDQMDATREKESADAELENENVNTERIEEHHVNSKAVQSTSTDTTRGSMDVDVLVPSIAVDSIKSELDQGTDDVIIGNDVMHRKRCDTAIKEESTLDYEFFSGGANSQNDAASKILFTATEPAAVASDSSDSSCSLSEFLRLCESSRDTSDQMDDSTAPPPAKRPKSTESQLSTATSRLEVKLEHEAEDLGPIATTSLNEKHNRAEIKLESYGDTIDNDILIIDSDDYILANMNGNIVTEEFISQSIVQNPVNYDEDMVPPNAFPLLENKEISGNDRTSHQIAHPPAVKEESHEWEVNSRCDATVRTRPLEVRMKAHTKPDSMQRGESIAPLKSKSEVLMTPEDDDDDLVPENNALCTRQSSVAFFDLTVDDEPVVNIKRELETQDLFSLPKSVEKRRKETRSAIENRSGINRATIKQNLNRKEHIRKKSNAGHCNSGDSDDDVIILDDDVTPVSHSTSQHIPRRRHCSEQSETMSIKRETPSPAASTQTPFFDNLEKNASNLERSFFGNHKISRHGDNLDRLFELLNSDSKDEL